MWYLGLRMGQDTNDVNACRKVEDPLILRTIRRRIILFMTLWSTFSLVTTAAMVAVPRVNA